MKIPASPLRVRATARTTGTNLLSYTLHLVVALVIMCLAVEQARSAGTVVVWGDNSHSQQSVPAGLTNAAAVAAGAFHSLALETGGQVVGWGDDSQGAASPPVGLTNIVGIAAGNGFSLGLLADGTIASWGGGSNVPSGLTRVIAVSAAGDNALALTRDGVPVSWGTTSSVPADLTNIVAIAAGDTHSLALKGDGTVVAWGDGYLGKTAVPPGLTDVVALAAGQYHSLALRADGTVVGWGDDTYNQRTPPPGLSNVVAIAAGALHSLALKQDGTVVAWGDVTYHQSDVPPGLSNVVAIAAGRYHSLAVVGDGSPVITVQPVAQYLAGSEKAIFHVMAVGKAPLTYQWQQNGTNIAGATDSTLTLPNLKISAAGIYSVTVSNMLGSVTSAEVEMPPASRRPLIVRQPEDKNVLCHDPISFTPLVDGTEPLSFQWEFDGVAIEGATNSVLTLDPAVGTNAGSYGFTVSNVFGSATSRIAVLTVVGQPPLITSSLTQSGKQGVPFTYQITALHAPTAFGAAGLPAGLELDAASGLIQGTPSESGEFDVVLSTENSCSSASTNMTLTIRSSVPVITSPLTASGGEQTAFMYQITATESPTSFGATNLPQGLAINPASGVISGSVLYAGEFDATISAGNIWGVGTATLHLSFSNAPITGLAIQNVVTNYSKPYLVEFQLALRDSEDPATSHAVVAPPRLMSVTAKEDDETLLPPETAPILQPASAKLLKAYLVLDFSDSLASIGNGDSNADGISDAIDAEVASAQEFVSQQAADAQIGVYEFHRDDVAPQQVISLTTDKAAVNGAIGGIWTNYVNGFSSGSRCWDALAAAIKGLGQTNLDERHYIIFISDGRNESSTNTVQDVLDAATAAGVQIYCVGFGDQMDAAVLQSLTSQTQGRFYTATNASQLVPEFAQLAKDLSGEYILRWGTLKRSSTPFMPSFEITYQGFTAYSPTNPPPEITGTNITVVTNADNTVVTNMDPILTTNYIIAPYTPTMYSGDVLVGALRLVSDADIHPAGITLRATYIPRYITQLRIHYRANWPCAVSLESTNIGEMLYGWTLTETNDGEGGTWALLSSPAPQDLGTSIPFADFGNLLTFRFRDGIDAGSAFSLFSVDNTIYPYQSFVVANTNQFVVTYAVLPYGTPVPWLLQHGFSSDFETAELSDPDGDGALTWQEYRAGTDPRDKTSFFGIRSVAPTGPFGRYQVTFSTAANRTYRVEVSDDLVNWDTLQENIVGTGADITVTDNLNLAAPAHLFYRVEVY